MLLLICKMFIDVFIYAFGLLSSRIIFVPSAQRLKGKHCLNLPTMNTGRTFLRNVDKFLTDGTA